MKTLLLDKTGGFPFDQQTLEFMQSDYQSTAQGIASAFGDNVILSGVADQGTTYGDGWIVLNGEILPFVGGTKAASIVVDEVIVELVFEDTETKEVEKVRVARTAVTGGTLLTDLIRIKPLAELFEPEKEWDRLIPSGVVWHVKMLSNEIATHFNEAGIGISSKWKGWAVDEDSQGKVIVGYKSDDTDFDAPDGTKTGGVKLVTLLSGQIPKHKHPLPLDKSGQIDGKDTAIDYRENLVSGLYLNRIGVIPSGGAMGDEDTGDNTGGQPHENMPPYVVYLNIVKL